MSHDMLLVVYTLTVLMFSAGLPFYMCELDISQTVQPLSFSQEDGSHLLSLDMKHNVRSQGRDMMRYD